MYNFYKNPPQTLDDIKDYLNSWLVPVLDDSVTPFDFKGTQWRQTHGFKRGFCMHQVFSNGESRFAFHVDDEDWNETDDPNMGIYDSWSEMINGVAMKHAIAWKIKSC